jgi:outer membrane protein, heavy metal efflux system
MRRFVPLRLVPGAAMLLLSACASYAPIALDPAQSAAQLEQRSLDDPALQAFIADNQSGRPDAGDRGDWDLASLTLAAFYFHPELDLARAQWAVARAALIGAGERPGPAIDIAPGTNTTTSTPSPRIVTATAELTLETAGKRAYRLAEAEQLAAAARLNIAAVAWQVQSRVRSNLLDLYGALERERLLAEQQALQADNVRILQGQYDAGAVSAFELTQAKLAADSARLALRDAERQEAEARVRLAEAIGVPVGALDQARFDYSDFADLPTAPSAAEARQQALLQRADVLGALAEYAASQSKLQLEIARQYPDLRLGPGYEYDQGDNKWSLGLGISLPGNRNRGAIAAATARRSEAAARFNALQANVLGEIDLALAGLRAALRKQQDATAMLADLTRQEQVSAAMLEAGAISGGDLVALRLQLSSSALARLDATLEAQRAAGQLDSAVQPAERLESAVWELPPRTTRTEGSDTP